MIIEQRLEELGLVLPEALKRPYGQELPFAFVRVHGNRAFVSGHLPQNQDGTVAGPFGKVGAEISIEQGYEAGRLTALSMLGSLKRELGDLDRIEAWVKALGMVNAAPGFTKMPVIVNGFSDLILEVFGKEVGTHSRSAVGMASLPFNVPIEIEGEVIIKAD